MALLANHMHGYVHEIAVDNNSKEALSNVPPGIFVEAFGGSCRLARCVARHGCKAESFEIVRSELENVLLTSQVRNYNKRNPAV